MYKGVSVLLCQFVCVSAGFVKYISFQNHIGSVAFGTVNLDQRRCGRHYYGCLYPGQTRGIGHALSMVSGRGSDQSSGLFFFGQGTDLIVRAPYLVGSCILHIFRLKIHPVSCLCRKIFTVHQLCLQCYLFYDLRSFLKFL